MTAAIPNVLLDARPAGILRWVLERTGRLQSAERAVPTHVAKKEYESSFSLMRRTPGAAKGDSYARP